MKKLTYILVALFIVAFAVDHFTAYTTIVNAQELPKTKKGMCIDIQQNGGWFKGHMTDIVAMCAKEGIRL